ncbi:MAG: DUF3849 domain-containing protein [Lachnospiraceae bacterium]|nr:DUF3849 domain-containing protein [Lachnospiraceae bacterium]
MTYYPISWAETRRPYLPRMSISGRTAFFIAENAAKPVVEEFGAERVAHVLAATVRYFDWDSRFSRDNKAWARTVPSINDQDSLGMDRSIEYVVESHPAVLDGFIRLARKEFIQEQSSEKSADGKRPSALEQLKADKDNQQMKSNPVPAKRREEVL